MCRLNYHFCFWNFSWVIKFRVWFPMFKCSVRIYNGRVSLFPEFCDKQYSHLSNCSQICCLKSIGFLQMFLSINPITSNDFLLICGTSIHISVGYHLVMQRFAMENHHLFNRYWLVVWLPFFVFPEILGSFHHPNWRTHIFQRGGPTTNQSSLSNWMGHLYHSLPCHEAPLGVDGSTGGTYSWRPCGFHVSVQKNCCFVIISQDYPIYWLCIYIYRYTYH